MPVQYSGKLLACVAVAAASLGCGTSAPAGGTRGASGNHEITQQAPTGGAAGLSPSVNAAESGNGNASTTLIVPTTASAPPTMTTVTAPTSGAGSNRDPITIDDCGPNNPAGLTDVVVQQLRSGGPAGALKHLYPYDGTVFPRGMLAPDLLWDGPADAVYVHIKSKIFEYTGCLKPTAAGQLTLPQDVWDKAGQRTFGKDDTFTLELTTLSQGKASGPVVSHFKIAQATIKGSIYYNSYSSMLGSSAMGASGGAATGFPFGGGLMGGLVLRIPAGGRVELFGQTSCNGCHSVSADGSRLLSQFVGQGAQSYELVTNTASTPVAAGARGAFGALYPNGSVYLTGSSVIEVARANMTAQGAGGDATLVDATNGQVVPNTGIPVGALMPMFSPDGTYLVFNDYAIDQAHGLAVMRYDVKTNTATDYKKLVSEPAGNMRPGWPFILPDNGAVVFARTDGPDFSGNGAGVMAQGGGFPGAGGPPGEAPFSELSIVDMQSSTVTLLAQAMGYATPADAQSNTTYLPFGAEELHHNYFPTLSPVAAGGYFWLFFDSVRHYGSLGSGRQLWGAAIDISPDGHYTVDPSHPAFYLPGQEFGTGNHRAFAALDPCRKDGDSCTSGIDCCGGFCYIESQEELVEPVGKCTPKMTMCAKRDERCSSDSDCCPPEPGDPPNSCIAGFCAFIPPLN